MALLRDSRASITEIALQLGYADIANSSHAFHRWTVAPPSAFRRRERA